MSGDDLDALLTGLEERFGTLQEQADRVGDSGTVLVVSCSMAASGGGVSLWPVTPGRTVVSVATLGNQTWDRHDGRRVVSGDVAHYASERDLEAVAVVGHTDCSVIRDAYDRHAGDRQTPTGIEARLAPLVALVADAADAGLVDGSTPPRTARFRLVEYNVVRQVEFLAERLPSTVTVAGYVHDRDGAYSPFPGKRYLVTVDGERDGDAIRSHLPAETSVSVARLLS